MHTLPVATAVKRARPAVEVDWLVNRSLASLLEDHPAVDRAIPFDRGRWTGPWTTFRRQGEIVDLVRRLRRARYDVAIDFQGLLRSGLLTLASGARRRIGFANAREGSRLAYDAAVSPTDHLLHVVDRNLLLLEGVVETDGRVEFDIEPHPGAVADVAALLEGAGRPRVVVFPLGRWPSKHWPAAACATFLSRLAARTDAVGVLAGSPDDRPYADGVGRLIGHPHRDLVGRTDLRQLVALVADADLVVAQDSAALHLAGALGVPTVALFGPSNPRYSGPYGVDNRVLRAGVDCSPCMRRTCRLGTTACLTELTGEGVFETVQDLLGETRAESVPG